MTNVLKWKGFTARVEYDADDKLFVGHLAGVNDIVGFHADTVAGLEAAFREAIDDYVNACRKLGKQPEKPFKGDIMLRVDPDVHAGAALTAQLSGKSLNKWAEEVLRAAVAKAKTAA
ncbi:MAG TPA: type II toxin-antitoxin system HicB family antitoxin [Caulobacterales bacterium]|nr:type II toxin-antitoxin system HicB family antitoxin [Caulobacterales bacterium]